MSQPKDKPKLWTIGSVLVWAAEDFRKRGNETARLDAELLLAFALGVDRITLIVEHQRPLMAEELANYRSLIQRRRNSEPIAYILGFREFYGHKFNVDPRVLIPRPDTETLVRTALRRVSREDPVRALDLCTGSGCVAISLKLERSSWDFLATDKSTGAVAVAQQNASQLGVGEELQILQSDLFSYVPKERFGLITANPPYIPDVELAELKPNVRDFEPRLALEGGQDGLAIVRPLVEQALEYLAPAGVLALEVGHDQAARVSDLLMELGYEDIERDPDYAGIERVVSARSPAAPSQGAASAEALA